MRATALLLSSAMVTVAMAGCHINYDSGGDWGDGLAVEGEFCAMVSDCEEDLGCIDNVCTPDDGQPADNSCDTNADCPQGSYCHEGIGKCVATGTCVCDDDCGEGLTCDEEHGSCVPGEDPAPLTCEEVELEEDCTAREDCEPIYAGVNCSCGPDCQCQGDEPNCVCESYEYFVCAPVE